MTIQARGKAMRMLLEDQRRDIYEGASHDGKRGSGLYYVTYSDGYSPTLNREDIDILLRHGLVTEKWPGCYVATCSKKADAK